MKILVYVPGMPFDGDSLKGNNSLGGSESMGYYVARGLVKKGHNVFCFSNVPDGQPKKIDGVLYMPIGVVNQQTPYGDQFQKNIESLPYDVVIAQRAPGVFSIPCTGKLNYWWTHDLALLRYKGLITSMIWSTDRFMCVSEFHKKQVMEVYGLPESVMGILPNGVDTTLYKKKASLEHKIASKTLLYTHRPERGLVNLVKPGGIMEKLLKIDPEIRLIISTYNYSTDPRMENEYNQIYSMAAALPNVQNVGSLSKKNLAQLQLGAWLHVYPTEFEETSCITAMEEQIAGTPIVSTRAGALPETLKDMGVHWTGIDDFPKTIKYLLNNPGKWKSLHHKTEIAASKYNLKSVVEGLDEDIQADFEKKTKDLKRTYRHFLYNNDTIAAQKVAEKGGFSCEEIKETFKMFETDLSNTEKFYEDTAKYNEEIKNTHSLGDYQSLLNIQRVQPILRELSKLSDGAKVLDYGCCVGQFTFAFASQFPRLNFVGVDIAQSQIDIANKHKEKNKVKNISFSVAQSPGKLTKDGYDFVYATEVLEHVYDYRGFLVDLELLCKMGGRILLSTPYGPHERNRPQNEHKTKSKDLEHLHNFEENDIRDLIEERKNHEMYYIADNPMPDGTPLGNWCWSYERDDKELGFVDYERKMKIQNPIQTVSACMIIRPDGDTLQKCLKSIQPFVDEIILGIDDPNYEERKGLCYSIIDDLSKETKIKTFQIPPPSEIGFDEVRNQTLEYAEMDWIVWIDDDEFWQWPERMKKYLRGNMLDGYCIHQHHISADPPGIIKTDLPTRIFRNHKGIQFFGVVHEHPEKEVNKGPGEVWLVPNNESCIMHHGYDTEVTRRSRFSRNWPLMVRDRKKYPNRLLGHFLWLRDLSHYNRFEYGRSGVVSEDMINRAKEAIAIYRNILKEEKIRLAYEGLPYVSECVELITQGGGFNFQFGFSANFKGMGSAVDGRIRDPLIGKLETREDIEKLALLMIKEQTEFVEGDNQRRYI